MRHLTTTLCLIALLSAVLSRSALSDGQYEPVASSASRYNWTGLYAGAHLGGTWGTTTAHDLSRYNALGDTWDADTSGFVAGAQAGYNWQWGPIVFGLEGDIGNLGLSGGGTTTFAPVAFDTSSRTESDFYLTTRGRLGFLVDDWLIYGTGGYIGADTRVSVIDTCTTSPPCGPSSINASDDSFRSGWTAGGGVEAALGGAWTAKAEYLYYDLGGESVSGLAAGTGPQFRWNLDTHGNVVRAGVNYKFSGTGY